MKFKKFFLLSFASLSLFSCSFEMSKETVIDFVLYYYSDKVVKLVKSIDINYDYSATSGDTAKIDANNELISVAKTYDIADKYENGSLKLSANITSGNGFISKIKSAEKILNTGDLSFGDSYTHYFKGKTLKTVYSYKNTTETNIIENSYSYNDNGQLYEDYSYTYNIDSDKTNTKIYKATIKFNF